MQAALARAGRARGARRVLTDAAAGARRAAPRRRAEPADLPPRRGALGLRPGAARGAARRQPELSLGAGARRRPRRRFGRARPDRGRRARSPRGCAATIAGLEIWQRIPTAAPSPTRRRSGRPAARGSSTTARAPEAADPDGPPVLVVPSLINRAYILDLAPGRSMLRWLAGAGPAAAARSTGARRGRPEAAFDLAAYGAERLLPALARGARGSPGGRCRSSATAWAARSRSGSRRGAPEDGRGAGRPSARPGTSPRPRGIAGGCRAAIRAEGAAARRAAARRPRRRPSAWCRSSFFQMLFALVNPMQAALKFQKLARLDPDGAGGAALRRARGLAGRRGADAGRRAAERPAGRLADPQPHRRRAAGASSAARVDPRRVAAPALVFCGERDSIAPPPLAAPLGRALPRARR